MEKESVFGALDWGWEFHAYRPASGKLPVSGTKTENSLKSIRAGGRKYSGNMRKLSEKHQGRGRKYSGNMRKQPEKHLGGAGACTDEPRSRAGRKSEERTHSILRFCKLTHYFKTAIIYLITIRDSQNRRVYKRVGETSANTCVIRLTRNVDDWCNEVYVGRKQYHRTIKKEDTERHVSNAETA